MTSHPTASQPRTGAAPTLPAGGSRAARTGRSRAARPAHDGSTRPARAARSRRVPVTVGGVTAIVLLVAATALVLISSDNRMRFAGDALVIAAALMLLVLVAVIGSVPRVLRDRALRRRFPSAIVVVASHGGATGTVSLVVSPDTVSVWRGGARPMVEVAWDHALVQRVATIPSPRSIQGAADLVLVINGRDEVFRPFRSASSIAERMHVDAVRELAAHIEG